MKRAIGAALLAGGLGLLGWAGYETLRPVSHYALTIATAPGDAAKELAALALPSGTLQRVEIRSPEERRPIASGLVAREDGRLVPLVWRNEVTDSILFADLGSADSAKVLAAIRDHVPDGAVVLAWWDFSRAIRLVSKRDAPLDDARARGLQIPSTWTEAREAEGRRWGAGAAPQSAESFGQFIDALLSDETQGAAALARFAGGKPAYVVAHISDLWKVAAAEPGRLAIAYKDFPSAGVSHGVIKSATQWMRDQKIDGAFAVEPIGGATRLHYLQRKDDSDKLITRLLPFSTSNPMQLERLELVYQHKGWWVYRLKN